ncbi:pyridoxal-phosphate dependent enzyme, partial [bacterium]|nr:pyridoxal-phosphate dependent enzyme [bacterium]
MNYYENMQDLIGNTPIVKLNYMNYPKKFNVFAKLELYNPSGSVKDRVGKYMIEDAEKKGLLKKGSTIIEATAGNMGLGIAFSALNKGYNIIFVVPEKFSEEKQTLMKALGAKIINTPRNDGMLGAEKKANELISQIENA